jgi:hypothetical protein
MSGPFDQFSWGSDFENAMWDNVAGVDDRHAQALYHEAYFAMEHSGDELTAVRDALQDYLLQEYGIDFYAEFDWEAWREAYSEA